jgi:hypothetical protein
MHQPSGEIVPSTVLQELGASNNEQLSQRASPFGVSWYFTDFCEAFAAFAGVGALTIAAPETAPAAPAATLKTFRREIPCLSVMANHPAFRIDGLMLNDFADKGLDLEQSAAWRSPIARYRRLPRKARYSR